MNIYHVFLISRELHFVPDDSVDTRQNTNRRLKQSAVPSLQAKEIKDNENLISNIKSIQRFHRSSQILKDITNIDINNNDKKNNHIYNFTCKKTITKIQKRNKLYNTNINHYDDHTYCSTVAICMG